MMLKAAYTGPTCSMCYYWDHRDQQMTSSKQWKKTHKEETKSYTQLYRNDNREQTRQTKNAWRTENREHVIAMDKQWRMTNLDHFHQLQHDSHVRRHDDVQYRLRGNLRKRLSGAVKGRRKAASAVRDLGCSIEELRKYLEARFYPHPVTGIPMTWANYTQNGWHIDHVFPLSKFDLTDREQCQRACHYTNLQPMWAEENIRKSDKVL